MLHGRLHFGRLIITHMYVFYSVGFEAVCITNWCCAVIFSEIKERIKKTKDEKKAKKAETMSKSQKSQVKSSVPKGAAPKGPKLGGGGGKRWIA